MTELRRMGATGTGAVKAVGRSLDGAAGEATAVAPGPVHLSVVVPLYNEEESVSLLIDRVTDVLRAQTFTWELILVDDGSRDATVERALARVAERVTEAPDWRRGRVRIIRLRRNFGQTAAMQAGIDAARGVFIATMDGDLQNDPADLPSMLERLEREDLDLLVGWRKNRQDGWFLRTLPSRIANRLIGRVTGVRLHDYGCSLKVYRGEVIRTVTLYGEMHRFIPAWMAMSTGTSRIAEQPVAHHARQFGESKYGLSRTFRVLLDLLVVYFFMRFRDRPGHFFGGAGLILGVGGSAALAYLAFVKFALGADIGDRPLLMIAVLAVMLSVQLLTTGILAELLARSFYASSRQPHYLAREVSVAWPGDSDGASASRARQDTDQGKPGRVPDGATQQTELHRGEPTVRGAS